MNIDEVLGQRGQTMVVAKAARRDINERARASLLADLAGLSRQARLVREQIADLDSAIAEDA